MEPVVVFVTASSKDEAERISRALLDARLAACCNIVNAVTSLFWWEGKIDRAGEVLMMVKTRNGLLSDVITVVKANHSYSVPEVIALPIVGGNPDYLQWISNETARG